MRHDRGHDRHDPQRAAAAYLAGELDRRQREQFEAHMLDCDGCWREVTAGRRGRALAESLREVAPQQLRERIRATIAASVATDATADATADIVVASRRRPRQRRPRRASRWRWRVRTVPGAVALLVGLLVLGLGSGGLLAAWEHRHGQRSQAMLQRETQPAAIAAAVAEYRDGMRGWPPPSLGAGAGVPPARQLGRLTWRESRQGTLAGMPVVAHAYQDAAGHRLVVLVAMPGQTFPPAVGARQLASGAGAGGGVATGTGTAWTAQVGGVVLVCADHPAPSLVVGADQVEVLAAAQRLGLW